MAAGQGMMLTEDHRDGHLMMMIAGILFISSFFLLFSTMMMIFPLFFHSFCILLPCFLLSYSQPIKHLIPVFIVR